MRVVLVASSVINWSGVNELGYIQTGEESTDLDTLPEIGGRACYQSWSRPNPGTADNRGYLQNILLRQHFSVLEHATVTLGFLDVSRSLTHELVRHRHFSFSQLSQRYVDESKNEMTWRQELDGLSLDLKDGIHDLHTQALDIYLDIYNQLVASGHDIKTARGVARGILPNCTSTDIVVTGNLRTWREFLQKRNTDAADGEIRQLAQGVLSILKDRAPNVFQDMV